MANLRLLGTFAPWRHLGAKPAAMAVTIVFLLTVVITNLAQAQTYQVIYAFTGGLDGAQPYSGVTIKADALYGTTHSGNEGTNWGDVYELRRHGSSWIFKGLQLFDGTLESRPIFGPDGTLYGTSPNNIAQMRNGYVYNLTPPVSAFCNAIRCPWNVNFPYSFLGASDGAAPRYGALVFDHAGSMYGTASSGGNGDGTVYRLTRSGGVWTEQTIYAFSGPDGSTPFNGVVVDAVGNLYGTTISGGQHGFGTVFELSPSGGGWTETVLYSFQNGNDGGYPAAGLVLDPSGNLYGATINGGSGGGGIAFKLTPSGGGWNYSVIQSFVGGLNCGPLGNLSLDSVGNLYGTTLCDGAHGLGNVFKLTASGGGYTYRSLYDFTGGTDGKSPVSDVAFDSIGNLYGTAAAGGVNASGVVWEIVP